MKTNIRNSRLLLMCVTMLMTLLLLLTSHSYAMVDAASMEMKTKYSDDTVVTKDNVLEILDDFGIEHSGIIYSEDESACDYTVAELREALLVMQDGNAEEGKLVATTVENGKSVRAVSTTKAKKISQTFTHDGYSLTHIANVKYKDSYFTDVTSTDITLDSDLLPIVYKITKERNISASFTKTKVTQSFDIDISSYVGVKYGLVKIGTSAHKGNTYFSADKFL